MILACVYMLCLCRHYLLRDVYDDMKIDGVQPTADIFHSFVVGVMKGARLSDAFFFREEMKSMGIAPDVCPLIFLVGLCQFLRV